MAVCGSEKAGRVSTARTQGAQHSSSSRTSTVVAQLLAARTRESKTFISRKYKRRSGRGRGRDRKDKNALQLSLLVSCESVRVQPRLRVTRCSAIHTLLSQSFLCFCCMFALLKPDKHCRIVF